jgi:hypothetical protein
MDNFYAFKCKRFRNIRNTTVELLLKHPVSPVKITLRRNYPK